jgi:hypothetical protein
MSRETLSSAKPTVIPLIIGVCLFLHPVYRGGTGPVSGQPAGDDAMLFLQPGVERLLYADAVL